MIGDDKDQLDAPISDLTRLHASGPADVAATLQSMHDASSLQFALLHTLALSGAGAALDDRVVRDVLAPRLPLLRELFLPNNAAIESAACVSAPHWSSLRRLSLHHCANLSALWADAAAIPVCLLHVDVTECPLLCCVPSPIARAIAARGDRVGVECDQPQCVYDGDAADDVGSVSIATNALTPAHLRMFDAVISLCAEADLPREALRAWGGAHALHVDVEDDEAAVLPLALTTAFLRAHRGTRRLVHCVVGASRSAATIAAWLVVERGLTLEQALAQLRSVRPICAPNRAFMEQLRRLQAPT